MGGCQNHGPLLSTLDIRCRTIIGTQKGTIILTTTLIGFRVYRAYGFRVAVLGRLHGSPAKSLDPVGF